MKTIDLRSDTVTQPTQAMREAMYTAEVGDDVYRDDPTVHKLEERAAMRFGKESALFVPSGTMGNQLAIMAQTNRGDEIILGQNSHIASHEVGAAAVLSGVNLNAIAFSGDMPDSGMIAAVIRDGVDIHEPKTAMICLENALANGRVVPLSVMREVRELGQRHGIPIHLDGARVFNAAAALGVDVREVLSLVDTVSCCLSKGLCAPVGSILAGPSAVIEKARKYRKMLGGGMRQCGILAAAGLLALEEMPAHLATDHENAKYLAGKLAELPGISVDMDAVEINMVFFQVEDGERDLPALLGEKGIKVNGLMDGFHRWVTHHDLSRDDLDYAVDALRAALS